MSKEILRTQRLILREMDPALDAINFYRLNADPEVLKFTGDAPFESIDQAREFIREYVQMYRNPGFGRWMIETKDQNVFIGFCGLKKHPDGMTDLGFRLLKDHWGKGYGFEAAEACIRYGFDTLGLQEIIGRASSQNIASIRILEKCGMKFWKTDDCDGISDSSYFSIQRSEYQKATGS